VKRVAALLGVLVVLHGAAHAALDERRLGRRFFLEARSQLPLVEDPAVVSYVERLGQRLVAALGPQAFDYHFYVVAHPSINAFAVPGGYIFVFSGLLARVANDDELGGVLAHEISHAHAHHIVRLQAAAAPWTAAALLGVLLGAVNPVLGAGAIAAAQTAQLKYSRDFEQEADFLGLRIATQAGLDPHALAGFFKQLLAEQRLNPTGVPPYMLSHPLTEDRVANVDAIIRSQQLRTPAGRPASGLERAEVQAVARAVAEPPDVVVEQYRRRAEENPADAEAQFLLGRVYQTVGQLEAARAALERSRQMGVGVGERVDRPLGAVLTGLRARADARVALERYLARHPDDGWSRLELGKALADDNEQAALREFQRAVTLDPSLDDAHRRIGIALGRRGQEGDGFYHLAVASQLRGDLEQALVHFERALEHLAKDHPRRKEVELAIEELKPIVVERERDRRERRRSGRRSVG
jgi:predicted Zn-dependent protease